jgi:hypothetical protein
MQSLSLKKMRAEPATKQSMLRRPQSIRAITSSTLLSPVRGATFAGLDGENVL